MAIPVLYQLTKHTNKLRNNRSNMKLEIELEKQFKLLLELLESGIAAAENVSKR